MTTPTFKSNAGDQNVCKKKSLSWLFGVDRKKRPLGSLFGTTWQSIVMPNSDLRTDFSVLTLMKDSYNLSKGCAFNMREAQFIKYLFHLSQKLSIY